jgi:hypothetical protein
MIPTGAGSYFEPRDIGKVFFLDFIVSESAQKGLMPDATEPVTPRNTRTHIFSTLSVVSTVNGTSVPMLLRLMYLLRHAMVFRGVVCVEWWVLLLIAASPRASCRAWRLGVRCVGYSNYSLNYYLNYYSA